MYSKEEFTKINKSVRRKHTTALRILNKVEKEIAHILETYAQDPNSMTHEEAEELLYNVRYKEELNTNLDYLTIIIQILNEFPIKK